MVNSICDCGGHIYAVSERGYMIHDAHETIERARDYQGAVSVKMYGGHVVEVSIQRFSASPW